MGNSIEAVLAHEIGHCKLRQIPNVMAASAGGVGGCRGRELFGRTSVVPAGVRVGPESVAPPLLLFGLLAGPGMFWLLPLAHRWSRGYQYPADAFAAITLGQAGSPAAAPHWESALRLGTTSG